jgi:hypothetical protein
MLGPKATCEWCGTEFRMEKSWQRFCKPKCRDDWNNRQKKLAAVAAAEAIASGDYQPTEMQLRAGSELVARMRRRV